MQTDGPAGLDIVECVFLGFFSLVFVLLAGLSDSWCFKGIPWCFLCKTKTPWYFGGFSLVFRRKCG